MHRVKLTRRATPGKGKSNGANGAAGKTNVQLLRPRKGEPPRNPEVASFVARISSAWQKSVAGIIEAGHIINEAKDKLKHGEFQKMIREQLPFGFRTAQMLMRIAKHPVLANAKFISLLPPSWGTLADLSLLSEARVLELIERGQLRADTTRAALKNFGAHRFAEVPKALKLLLQFQVNFPDPQELASELVEEGGGLNWYDADFDFHMRQLPKWIEQLLLAAKKEAQRIDAELNPDDPPGPEIIVDERGRHFKDDPQHADGEHGEE